jgi:L-amino acid N-acyltransferase YncA
MLIRDATNDDWPGIWSIFRPIAAAGETYCLPTEIPEEEARTIWLAPSPSRAVVALDDDGAMLGTARMYPNQMGPGAHVASASFMVDPDRSGAGVGRGLAEHVLARARSAGFRAMQFNAVVETNRRAVELWRSLGFEVLTTIPEAFAHPSAGYVGLHVMYRRL